MERRITSLGKTNVSKMKKAFDFKNINKIVENYALAPKAKKYSDVIKNQALELLRDDYNDAVDELNKQQKKRTTFNSLIQQNSQYLNKKVAANENRKSNKISTFFKSYNKPINMEKRMKYKIGGETIWEKQVVDVYSIDVSKTSLELKDIFQKRVLPVLGNLYRKYKGGYVQLDLFGKWSNDDEEEPLKKISVVGNYLSPSNYSTLYEDILKSIKPPDSASHFIIFRVIFVVM